MKKLRVCVSVILAESIQGKKQKSQMMTYYFLLVEPPMEKKSNARQVNYLNLHYTGNRVVYFKFLGT